MNLKRANSLLLIAILLVDGYIALAPAIPSIWYRLDGMSHEKHRLTQLIQKAASTTGGNNHSTSAPIAHAEPNHVIIPSMSLDQPILEGPVYKQYAILAKGIWRWPHSSTPDKGGNTVLVGHRFTYTNPRGVFYFLNKVKVGDTIAIFWKNTEYTYKVAHINVVPPTDTNIENNTKNPQLTLFTCTPLWLPKDRLVVVANLIGTS